MGKPAARITDQHLCPRSSGNTPHVGLPIAQGCPTVFIGGQPAARVGDMAPCIGPPDKIAKGSRTVLIGGKPAARLGDRTAHGGRITTGFPTVLIGDSGSGGAAPVAATKAEQELAEKIERLDQRESLIDQGRQRAAAMTGKGSEELVAATDRFERNIPAVERAKLAQDVYRDPSAGSPPPGWARLSAEPESLPPELRDIPWSDPESGYGAALYESKIDGSRVLVFRGTDNLPGWESNVQQGLGYESKQYDLAAAAAKSVKRVYGDDFEIAGHSLGGGLAQTATSVTGQPATIFNASGPHPDTLKRLEGLNRGQIDTLVEAYHVKGEALTGGQRPYTNILFTPIGTAGRYVRAGWRGLKGAFGRADAGAPQRYKPVWVYDAVGNSHTLPAVNENLESPSIFRPKSLVKLNPIERHLMGTVVNGFERQKADDEATINRLAVR